MFPVTHLDQKHLPFLKSQTPLGTQWKKETIVHKVYLRPEAPDASSPIQNPTARTAEDGNRAP